MNKVLLCGRLTRDPDIRTSQGANQMLIARYTLAVDKRGRRTQDGSEQNADFIQCVAFDKGAEFAQKYLHQGTKLIVTGHIQTGSYTNREGVKVYTTDIIVEDQEFAESKNAASGNSNGNFYSNGNISTPSNNASMQDPGDGFMNIPDAVEDDGLPFN